MRISDWSSNVCSSDLMPRRYPDYPNAFEHWNGIATHGYEIMAVGMVVFFINLIWSLAAGRKAADNPWGDGATTPERSEEHTSDLQSLMRTAYAVVCLKKNINSLHQDSHPVTTAIPRTP